MFVKVKNSCSVNYYLYPLFTAQATVACFRVCAISAITFHMNRRASGSMPALGSSRKMISGSPIIAIATQSLRLGWNQL